MCISFSDCELLLWGVRELEVRSFLDKEQRPRSLAKSGTQLEASLMFLYVQPTPRAFELDVLVHQQPELEAPGLKAFPAQELTPRNA
jgi:hypothetical protein